MLLGLNQWADPKMWLGRSLSWHQGAGMKDVGFSGKSRCWLATMSCVAEALSYVKTLASLEVHNVCQCKSVDSR